MTDEIFSSIHPPDSGRETPDRQITQSQQRFKSMKSLALAVLILITGCSTSSHKVTGMLRPATASDKIWVYYSMPQSAKVIGTIYADSFNGATLQQASSNALEKLKMEAAKLGANGIVVNPSDEQALDGAELDGRAIFVEP
jgi:streptogramin lyase